MIAQKCKPGFVRMALSSTLCILSFLRLSWLVSILYKNIEHKLSILEISVFVYDIE